MDIRLNRGAADGEPTAALRAGGCRESLRDMPNPQLMAAYFGGECGDVL